MISVMRTQGSLRLILNTKVFPGMTVMRASQKSVRLTATDGDEGVKVFLLMVRFGRKMVPFYALHP